MEDMVRTRARLEPSRLAVSVDGGPRWTYGDFESMANRLAHLFRREGLQRGDHIAVAMHNDPAVFALAWAAWRSGLYFTPIPFSASADTASCMVRDCKAKLVVIDARLEEFASPLAASLPGEVRAFSWGGALPGLACVELAIADLPSDPVPHESPGALMLYTSGTTGRPKGIWRPLLEMVEGPPPFAADLMRLFHLDGDSRVLSTAPLYHASPLRTGLSTLAAGGELTVMARFDAGRALELLESLRPTHSQWVPTMFRRLVALPEAQRVAFRLPDGHIAVHAAAPCPVDLKLRMIRWWGPVLLEYYGGTESVGVCTIDSHEWMAHMGSVGQAKSGVVEILDDAGNRLPAGEVGRIYFRGARPFEYFGDPEKTRRCRGPEGQFTIGDIGYLDGEGYLYLTDRADDMIISGGVNIYPQELEAVLCAIEGVADCAVVGVPHDDFGEQAVACVVLDPGVAAQAGLLSRIKEEALRRLGRVKRPREYVVVPTIERTLLGKLERRKLGTRVRELLAPNAPMS